LLLLAPNRGNRARVEFTWRGLELIVGNYYVLTLLVLIAATACAPVLTRRLRPERAQSGPEPDAVCGTAARRRPVQHPAGPSRTSLTVGGVPRLGHGHLDLHARADALVRAP
jgi:hypothetical protein